MLLFSMSFKQMSHTQKLLYATELLQRCSDGFGAFINGRKMARKDRDALRRDISDFLDGARSSGINTTRDLLVLARAEIYHNAECEPGKPCVCENGELMRQIDAVLKAR